MGNGTGCSDSERQKVINEMLTCQPSLRRLAMSLSGNEDRAQDLVQQTILKGLSNLGQFQPGTNMVAWLSTILRNNLFSELRKHKREQGWQPEFENTLMFSTGLGAREAEAAYDFRRLLLYLVCLPADQSDALIAIGYLGMCYEDAADRLGCRVGTVKSRVSRARSALTTLMQGTALKQVNLSKLKTATKDFPQSHPYFPIAKAYEELYMACEGVSEDHTSKGEARRNGHLDTAVPSEIEKAWQELVASGALDDDAEDLSVLIRSRE